MILRYSKYQYQKLTNDITSNDNEMQQWHQEFSETSLTISRFLPMGYILAFNFINITSLRIFAH